MNTKSVLQGIFTTVTKVRVNSQIGDLYVLFGPPGVGKTYAGNLLQDEFGFSFFDADWVLPQELIEAHARGEDPTQELRDQFFDIVIEEIRTSYRHCEKLVVVQAFLKQRNRWQFKLAFPQTKFVWLRADQQIIAQRISTRGEHQLTPQRALEIQRLFEEPEPGFEFKTLWNTGTKENLIAGLREIVNALWLDTSTEDPSSASISIPTT